jgi:hypothetical protein
MPDKQHICPITTQASLSMLESKKIYPSYFLLQKLITLHQVNILGLTQN